VIATRSAASADNAALIDLAAACPMVGDITMCVDRNPDFFALNRLEGDRWSVGIAQNSNTGITGCVALASRRAYLFGEPSDTAYAGDLKVHPRARGGRTAESLIGWARNGLAELGPDDLPSLVTIMAGNRDMERLTDGRRGNPVFERFATVRVHAVPLLLPRRPAAADLRIAPADANDVGAMMALWRRVAPGRQFAPVFDPDQFTRWVASAPGLRLHDYWLARRRDGQLAGFIGIWEQSTFKQLRVLAYSRRLAAMRLMVNAAARITGSAMLPPPGAVLRTATAVHVCVPGDSPRVLHALLRRIHETLRARHFSVFTIGLDPRDPLSAALGGLMAQPTDVHGYVTTRAGHYAGPRLDDRPFHYDIALV
jgi:hypothetical protein